MKAIPLAMAALFIAFANAPAARSQDLSDTPTAVEEVVVTARRSGAPIWTIRQGGSTLILVGGISGIPREVAWRPEDLETVAREADLILTPQVAQLSPADLFRLIWRQRTLGSLPEGRTTADYLDADTQRRLEAVMAGERGDGWRRRSLLILGMELLRERAGFGEGRQGQDAVEVVRRAGRRADVELRPVGRVRGDDLIDNVLTAPQETHAPCITAAVAAAEAGPDTARERAVAWRARNVPAVVASPIDRALARCWPWADPDMGPVLHGQWTAAIEEALSAPRVTLAVAPLRLLADEGGVLDRLEARGLEIEGPVWRADGLDAD